MTTSTTRGRYRAVGAASTPLHTFADNLGPNARRAVALAATSGIILTVGAPGAIAAPAHVAPVSQAIPVVEPEASLATTAVISVATDAAWSVGSGSVTSEGPPPPPPPPPPPAPVIQRAPAVSRTNERTVPVAQNQQTAPAATAGEAPAAAAAETPAAPAAAPASGTGAAIVAYARTFNGTSYSVMDCSKFTQTVFAHFGVSLGRSSSQQINAGRRISAAEARPGDLMWWPGHVAIYTGNGNHIAARNPSSKLHESKIHRGGAIFLRVIE